MDLYCVLCTVQGRSKSVSPRFFLFHFFRCSTKPDLHNKWVWVTSLLVIFDSLVLIETQSGPCQDILEIEEEQMVKLISSRPVFSTSNTDAFMRLLEVLGPQAPTRTLPHLQLCMGAPLYTMESKGYSPIKLIEYIEVEYL